MDITLQMRSIELFMKFLRHDLKDVPPYGYARQVPPCVSKVEPRPLPRATPEAMGVSSAAMERLFREMGARVDTLGVHAAMVLRHGHVIAEGAWAPYRLELPHMLYSMSKSVTATAIGLSVDEGLLTPDEFIADIFKEEMTPGLQKSLKGLTLRHLLTMSSGSRFNEVGSMLDGDWARMFLESAPKFQPGTAFEYNSLNSYMLCAVLKKRTGMGLVEYLEPRLFAPLHIGEYSWECCPKGLEKGGWGLMLKAEDCAKLGQLYLNGGVWEGQRILSPDWVEQATHSQIDTPNAEMKDGYGFQIWMNGRDAYQFNGAFGQYVIVSPKQDTVVVLLSGSPNLFAEGDLNELLAASFWIADDAPLPEAPTQYARLQSCLAGLTFSPALPAGAWRDDPGELEQVLTALDGREYRLENNTGGLLPQSLQAVHGNYTMGLNMLRFERQGMALRIDLYEGYMHNAFLAGLDYIPGAMAMRADTFRIGARLRYTLEPDGDIRLCVTACFTQTPDTRIFVIDIRQNAIRVTFHETPTVLQSSRMLMQLVGYSETAFVKRMATGMKRLPGMGEDTIDELMRRFTLPVAEGALILQGPQLLLPPPLCGAETPALTDGAV